MDLLEVGCGGMDWIELSEWGNLRVKDHLGEPGVDGRIILRWVFRKWDEGVKWIDLAEDMDGWPAFVNTVMNLRVP
jgi:hypothetical protein